MRTYRTHQIDRETAEQLLRGRPAGSGVPEPLAALLAAASAPAREHELAGEHAALAAFREARLDQMAGERHPSMTRTAFNRLFSLRVAVATFAATATLGGAALAASTGALPTPLSPKAPATRPAPSAPAPSASADGPGSQGASTSPDGRRSGHPSAAPASALVGLFRAWQAQPAANREKALEKPPFAPLVRAAGGEQKVPAYCATVLAGAPSKQPKKAGPSSRPTEGPRSAPSPRRPEIEE